MIFLTIDTSLQGITIGLARLDGRACDIWEVYGSTYPQEATARLPELCLSLLEKRGLALSDIHSILVSHGPGSFTGIKIGLSFVSGWKMARTPVQVWGVSSLKGLLTQHKDLGCLALPATQGAGYFVSSNALLSSFGVVDLSLSEPFSQVSKSSSIRTSLAASNLGSIAILGRWPRLEDWLNSNRLMYKCLETESQYRSIVAGMIEEFVANSAELSEGCLIPVYLRKSAPEEKLEAARFGV